jgi:ABC-type polar amino acid transport system ATPase subunit
MSIRVTNLQKTHPGSKAPALQGLSLEVPPGKLAAILGQSGAGKSTLLRCLVGLDRFDHGMIEMDGVRIDADQIGSRRSDWTAALNGLRGRVGMVFQSFELFPHLTVLENCTLAPTRVKGVVDALAEATGLSLLDELGLRAKAGAYPDQLSGGQKQRVAIARALCMDPAVLLYDEPTSALDPSLRHEVLQTLQRVSASGMTQVVVTHDIDLAREAADLVFVLDAGRIAEAGPPAEIFARPAHEATKRLLRAR